MACDGRFELSEMNEGRVPKYTDVFKSKHQRNPLFFGLMCPVILARGYRIGGL